jgi:enoyl-CoA hydratase
MTRSDDILFETKGRAGVITLNKPETLNAVTDAMLTALNDQLDIWETEPSVRRVLIKAVAGRAFSAGGDIRHLYECGIRGQYDFDFFAREYRLNARIAKFPKPYIALLDGIAMGGGVGVSFHGSHRIAGDNVVFAMPEVGIGFFPDIGASHFLSRLAGKTGLYLALTGTRIRAHDTVWSGLATHGCRSQDLTALEKLICEEEDWEDRLNSHHQTFLGERVGPQLLESASIWIDRHFGRSSVDEIVNSLAAAASHDDEESGWAIETLKALKRNSPTSLEIAFRQITRGAVLDIDACMKMEYRIVSRILAGHDFYEGIRAAIIDKDRAPKWQPETLQSVDAGQIEMHFLNLGDAELTTP